MGQQRDKSRKTKKANGHRDVKPVKLDDDMQQLAAALAQNATDEGPTASLAVPWRNGWNAAQFGINVAMLVEGLRRVIPNYCIDCVQLVHMRSASRDTKGADAYYWDLQDSIETLSVDEYSAFWRATLRCAQVMCTKNGSGDGSIFNAIWERALWSSTEISSLVINQAMLSARCRDVLGTSDQLCNDQHDFYRRAFKTAWERRLFKAAYALPFVGDISVRR